MRSLILLLTILSPSVFAEYQYSVAGGLTQSDSNSALGIEASNSFFSITRYFKPVEKNSSPLAESGYLSKQSFVHMSTSKGELETKLSDSKDETKGYEIGARIVGKGDIILEFEIGKKEFESNNFFTSDQSFHEKRLSVGRYMTDRASINLVYINVNDLNDGNFVGMNRDVNAVGVNFRNVSPLKGNSFLTTYGSLGESRSNSGDVKELNLGGIYYPNQNFGVGVYLGIEDGDADSTTYGLQSSYFFTKDLSGRLVFLREDNDLANVDVDTIGIGFTFRL